MKYASKAYPLKGRLLVDVIKSTAVDAELGIELGVNQQDTVKAIVVKSSDDETIPVGSEIMYDRIHGKAITLLDDSGSPHEYKVVQVADVSLILLE